MYIRKERATSTGRMGYFLGGSDFDDPGKCGSFCGKSGVLPRFYPGSPGISPMESPDVPGKYPENPSKTPDNPRKATWSSTNAGVSNKEHCSFSVIMPDFLGSTIDIRGPQKVWQPESF